MNKVLTRLNYQQRIETVVTYIANNLEQDLEVNQLAEIANFSPYHFHRIYREMMLEPVNATVRRYRLQYAAHQLIRSEQSIVTIAKQVRYGSVEAFSRAFLKGYGLSPAQYRQQRRNDCHLDDSVASLTRPVLVKENITMYEIEMISLPETRIIGLDHKGNYMKIGAKFDQLFMQAGTAGLLAENTRSLGLYFDDPKSVAEQDLRSAACVTIDEQFFSGGKLDSFIEYLIPAGQYATLLFKGPYAELEKPYSWMFGEWLPDSGHEAGDFPPIEEYLNDPKETPPEELLTRIHCLIAAA
ncbi:MAG: AraC family transcriptional regulator [Arenicella sp.]